MPKVIETKLKLSADLTQAESNVKAMSAAMVELASKMSDLSKISMPDWMAGTGPGGRGGAKRMAIGSVRSPHAPSPDRDLIKMRGGTGWGGMPYFGFRGTGPGAAVLGAAGRFPTMAGGVAGAAIEGGGLAHMGGLLQQVGGGLMGAFGGFGAAVGIPLLALGVGMGLGHMFAQPRRQWEMMTGPMSVRLGRGWLEGQRRQAARFGIMPEEMVQYTGRLERVGAQQAGRAMWRLAGLGMEPGMTAPIFEAFTRMGGMGARTDQEYIRLAASLRGMTADTKDVVSFLERLVSLTQMVEQHTSDLKEEGSREIMSITKWTDKFTSPTAAVRGAGTLMNWMAAPGGPGKELFLWSIAARSPELMASIGKRFGTENLTAFRLRWAMRPGGGAFLPALQGIANLPGELPYHALTAAGITDPEIALQMMERLRSFPVIPGGPNAAQIKELEDMAKKGMKDPGQYLKEMAADTQIIRQTIVSGEFVKKVTEAEKKLVEATGELIKKLKVETILGGVADVVGKLAGVVSGDWSKFVEDGMTAALGKYFKMLGPGGVEAPNSTLLGWVNAELSKNPSAHPKGDLLYWSMVRAYRWQYSADPASQRAWRGSSY